MMTHVYPAPEVVAALEPLPTFDSASSVRSLLNKPVEQMAVDNARLIVCDDEHPLARAVCTAFYGHYPLVLSPDDVWFCLMQGFAQHMRLNSESLRQQFVSHEGKLTLLVERADFMLGQTNPWPEVFAAFSQQIAAHVGAIHQQLSPSFSTTTATHRAACDVTLMDSFQGYFEYELRAGCGIPQITLLGTKEDWAKLRAHAEVFTQYGLERWGAALLPVLERIEATVAGETVADEKVEAMFWRSIFRYQGGSGPAEMTGWLLTFFPYLLDWSTFKPSATMQDAKPQALRFNPYLDQWADGWKHATQRTGWLSRDDLRGPGLPDLPSGLSSAPVKITLGNSGQTRQVRFVAGMVGVAQDAHTLAVRPSFGWAVVSEL